MTTRSFIIAGLCLTCGIVIGWMMRSALVPPGAIVGPATVAVAAPPERPIATGGAAPTAASPAAAAIGTLEDRRLALPIESADVSKMRGSFAEVHSGHAHEAVDILAPRGTPIHAVDDGKIAKLFESKAGGHTIYQYDPTGRFCYYYAHLDSYAAGLRDGDPVARGQVIGYVGTSGNAPPDTPHLHFTIFQVTSAGRWWDGKAIDPYLVFSH